VLKAALALAASAALLVDVSAPVANRKTGKQFVAQAQVLEGTGLSSCLLDATCASDKPLVYQAASSTEQLQAPALTCCCCAIAMLPFLLLMSLLLLHLCLQLGCICLLFLLFKHL
jgi:hypothetical protein